MSTFDPDALECLAAIIEEGGFERAAQRLSITQSAVSQRLRALEAQVGTVLIVRSRPLKPTPAGQLMLKHAKMMRLLRADLETELRELAPGAGGAGRDEERVSIAINADSIATWAMPALDALVRQGLPVEIITDNEEFTQEWLREGQVLGCVTSLGQTLRGCRMVPLGCMDYVAVAQADFARSRCPKGLSAHNFHQLPFVAFNRKDYQQHGFVEQAFGLPRVGLKQLYVPSSVGQLRAVQAGWGVSVPDCSPPPSSPPPSTGVAVRSGGPCSGGGVGVGPSSAPGWPVGVTLGSVSPCSGSTCCSNAVGVRGRMRLRASS